jgi:uncharacterized coiled-coil DUF342 family protein
MSEDADKKAETLTNLIEMHEKLVATRQDVKKLDTRVSELEQQNQVEHRQIKNQIKHTFWEMMMIIKGQRDEIDKVNHRVTDSCEDIDELQKILRWVMYTVIGLVITTCIAAALKAVWGL